MGLEDPISSEALWTARDYTNERLVQADYYIRSVTEPRHAAGALLAALHEAKEKLDPKALAKFLEFQALYVREDIAGDPLGSAKLFDGAISSEQVERIRRLSNVDI